MWGQEKNIQTSSREQAANSTIADGAGDISAFVGKGVEFKGTISYSGTVKIDGYLDGEIDADGVLLIGEEAVIQAKVTATTIVCKGKITGDIVAKARVELRAPPSFGISRRRSFYRGWRAVHRKIEMAHGVCDIPREALLPPSSHDAPNIASQWLGEYYYLVSLHIAYVWEAPSIALPDQSQPLKVELASVRCVKKDQFAVSFQEMLPDTRRVLYRCLSYSIRRSNQKRPRPLRHPLPYLNNSAYIVRALRDHFLPQANDHTV
jgi:hypothetical protein